MKRFQVIRNCIISWLGAELWLYPAQNEHLILVVHTTEETFSVWCLPYLRSKLAPIILRVPRLDFPIVFLGCVWWVLTFFGVDPKLRSVFVYQVGP